jgi:hypothetical protein
MHRILLLLAVAGCSRPAPQQAERWSVSDCSDGGSIHFLADGTWMEMNSGSGRWSRRGDAVHLRFDVRAPDILTAAPITDMSQDEDGILPIVAPGVMEARVGAATRRVRRCSCASEEAWDQGRKAVGSLFKEESQAR